MSLKDRLLDHLKQFHTAPFLFIGAGLSRRYLGLDDWTSLLQRMSSLTGRPYAYYRATGNGNLPAIATEIARELHPLWWIEAVFEEVLHRLREIVRKFKPPGLSIDAAAGSDLLDLVALGTD